MALSKSVRHWCLTTLREKLIKIGAKVVRHAKYVTFQMAEVAIPRVERERCTGVRSSRPNHLRSCSLSVNS
jgi:hypothetical protein